ncbi:Type 1 glutamine amidotransferase-like domain-containing protein [Clostridium sp.]|uniref:Type 1 glutamine amidotransferase-like domain-containing protein n=1 Tax=Clostridium sp. TaxID=1506 RepID=UPI0032177F70
MVNIFLSEYNFHGEWAKDTIKKYINYCDKVVVIPFAFSEKWISNNVEWQNAYNRYYGNYYKEVVEPFLEYGIDEDNIVWLNYFEDTDEEMRRIIESSNIIFITGGLPDIAVERVIERGLLNYIDSSKIIMGASAGALMQLNNYYISPDEDYTDFMYCHGLELVNKDFYIEVHYEDTDIQNDCIKRVLKEKTDTIYAIKDNGGIIVDSGNLLLLGDVVTFKNN